ncbi:MAG: Condensation domain protein [Methanomassiliicoccales archaeon PtaU1.Bin124]|nr:MAG: Condensation domain protein [Methanomassiliicoccales archaeon PtaU1.Bin124]
MQRQPASALDLFTDSVRSMGDATMVSVLEFDRHLDAHRMEVAARRCLDAYPILSSRLVRGKGPAYWEHVDSRSEQLVTVVDIGNGDYRPYIVLAVDPFASPQMAVRMLRSHEHDVLVINLAHAAADGSGLKELASSLLKAYIDPDSIRPAHGLPVRDTLWTGSLLEEDLTDDVQLVNTMWPSSLRSSNGTSTYHRCTIAPEGVAAMKSLASRYNGTINDLLMASFYLSLSEFCGHYDKQGISFPVNLRQHLRDGSRCMTNQAANVGFSISRSPQDTLNEVLPKVVQETSRLKQGRIGIREQVAFDRCCDPEGLAVHRMVEEMAQQQRQGQANIFISNPGPITLPTFPGLADAYLAYPGGYMPTTCFIITTFQGSMSITMGYQQDQASTEATSVMMDGFLDNLGIGRQFVHIL